MKLQVEFRSFCRPFRQSLTTAHGSWTERRGFLLKVTDREGRSGYGEVAPVPWLGSETLEEAERFLGAVSGGGRAGSGGDISRLPACRFALDAAMDELRADGPRDIPARRLPVAALLPAGEEALPVLQRQLAEGFRHFKWKIGVHPAPAEQAIFRDLTAAAPADARFRLDANGGLGEGDAAAWLELLDESSSVDFLEQPLPPSGFEQMKTLQKRSRTPIALDESVSGARQFEEAHRRGWRGLYVIKPAIFGAMREGEALLPPLRPRIIISSVFETSVGYEAVLRWASRWQSESFAAGVGTGEALEEDGLFLHPTRPQIIRGLVQCERIWERLTGRT